MGPPDIYGIHFIVAILIAIIYWIIWLLIFREEFIGVLFSIGLAWGTCYSISWIGAFTSAIWTSLTGLSFSIWSIAQVIGLVVLGLGGIVALFFLGKWLFGILPGLYEDIIAWYRSRRKPVIQQANSNSYQLRQNEFFHGTSNESAWNIYNTGYWLIGDSQPHGIYMTDEIETAKIYARNRGDGLIVLVRYNPDGGLDKFNEAAYCYHVEVQEPNQEYHLIRALTPIHILDLDGRIITSN